MRLLVHMIMLFLPFVAYGQFFLKGIVNDATTGQPMAGVNVAIKGQQETNTDANGQFSIPSNTSRADVRFSFIGFVTLSRTIREGERVIILLQEDKSFDIGSYYVKTSIGLGYLADLPNVKRGAMVDWTIQSIGKSQINLQSIGKYWAENRNRGFEITLSKSFSAPLAVLADNLMIGYRSLSFGELQLEWGQSRLMITNQLPRYFAFDVGVSQTDQRVGVHSPEEIRSEFWSGVFGISKAFSFLSPLRTAGVYSNIYFNPRYPFIEAGAFKAITIKKIPKLTIFAKYYHYDGVDGVMVSLRMTAFSTRYSCCDSWYLYQEDMMMIK